MELVAILVLVALAAGGVYLGRRIRASSGTIGAPVPPGTPGIVQAPLEPTGTVLLGGEPGRHVRPTSATSSAMPTSGSSASTGSLRSSSRSSAPPNPAPPPAPPADNPA